MIRFARYAAIKPSIAKNKRVFSTGSYYNAARRALNRYTNLCERNPWSSAFVVCFVKSALSDIFSQRILEGKNGKQHSWKRTLVFASFGGWYCGWAQHLLYNRLYPIVFGAGQTFWPIVSKIAAECVVVSPFVVLPSYYAWRNMLLPEQGIVRLPFEPDFWSDVYKNWEGGVWDITSAYCKIWIPAHAITFGLCPPPLRISWVAFMSFIWLIIKSTLAHRDHSTGGVAFNEEESDHDDRD